MQYSNELKVGAAIVLAVVAIFVGIRFFQNVPLFRSSYTLYAEFDDANGLVAGNPVRMKGVSLGSVERVHLDPESQTVRVRMKLNRDPNIPKGSHAKISGFSALGGVHVSIIPGPRENPQLSAGTTLTPPETTSSLSRLTERAPALATKADSVLTNTNKTVAALSNQFRNPNSDLRRTLASVQQITNDLESVTEAEKKTIRALLQNLRAVSSDLKVFMAENGDSLDVAVHRLNQSLNRLNRSLASFEQTSATLDTITTKLNQGTGTAGRLLNDPGLYMKMDSAAAQTNSILQDFRDDPGQYLDELTLVKVF